MLRRHLYDLSYYVFFGLVLIFYHAQNNITTARFITSVKVVFPDKLTTNCFKMVFYENENLFMGFD